MLLKNERPLWRARVGQDGTGVYADVLRVVKITGAVATYTEPTPQQVMLPPVVVTFTLADGQTFDRVFRGTIECPTLPLWGEGSIVPVAYIPDEHWFDGTLAAAIEDLRQPYYLWSPTVLDLYRETSALPFPLHVPTAEFIYPVNYHY